jgi:hypothetical protein
MVAKKNIARSTWQVLDVSAAAEIVLQRKFATISA